jgi:hypothetical protein
MMYRANDGSLHYSEESARRANEAQGAMASLFIVIILFFIWLIPRVVGVVTGFILGLCFKLVIVGRILTTLIVSVVGAFIVVIFTQPMGTKDAIIFLKILQGILLFGALGGIGFWWWGHYEKIRHNNIPYTVMVIKKCACIVFYGTIAMAILFAILGDNISLISEVKAAIAFLVPFAIALFLCYIPDMTNPQIEDCGDASSSYDDDDGGREEDIDELIRAAEQGDAEAQCDLANRYEEGEGVQKDLNKAAYWYGKSAEQGNANSQFCLASCYSDGSGVEENLEKAVYWYKKSAEQGQMYAQNVLGSWYENGYGVEKDREKAVYWYTKSADQGYEDSIKKLKGLK